VGLLALLLTCLPAVAAERPVVLNPDDPVEQAIAKAKAHLYGKMNKDHNWEATQKRNLTRKNKEGKEESVGGADVSGGQWGGVSAIAVYALLASGESPQDPKLKPAIEWLMHAEIVGIYALGMRTQMYAFVPITPEVKQAAQRDYLLLLNSLKSEGDAFGKYDYLVNDGPKGRMDHSVSQYGVLGMWALAQSTHPEVPLKYWEIVDRGWRNLQHPAGTWSYEVKVSDQHPPNVPMTAAGIATLFITQDFLNRGRPADCKGNIQDPAIDKGLKWIAQHFNEFEKGNSKFYNLYGIERIGVASGIKYFGTIDWYGHGSRYLLNAQDKNSGNWGSVPDTCFAVLFLVRGRAPIVMNKLDYDLTMPNGKKQDGNWNQRPRDLANFTHWMGKNSERYLNWQIVNLQGDPDELHDAPILYLAGNQAINFSDEEVKKLKQYVDGGGLIMGNPDCASKLFGKAFRDLGKKMYPDYEFKALPDEHAIYTLQQYPRKSWRTPVNISALTNESRVLMILLPDSDPSRLWHQGVFGGSEAISQFTANVFLYQMDRGANLRFKGQTHIVKANSAVRAEKTIKVARLVYTPGDVGISDPEPGGWRRLAAVMHNRFKTDVDAELVELGKGKLDAKYQVAHLTGTGPFKLTPAMQGEIRKYVEGGGTLVIDACGGSSGFAAAAEGELAALFPGTPLPPNVLPAAHPMYKAGEQIGEVMFRAFARRVLGAVRTPLIRGIDVGNRTAVFYSKEDLSTGLIGTNVDGVIGYVPTAVKDQNDKLAAGATELMTNILLHAAGVKAQPSTPPPAPAAAAPQPAVKKEEPKKPDGKKGGK